MASDTDECISGEVDKNNRGTAYAILFHCLIDHKHIQRAVISLAALFPPPLPIRESKFRRLESGLNTLTKHYCVLSSKTRRRKRAIVGHQDKYADRAPGTKCYQDVQVLAV